MASVRWSSSATPVGWWLSLHAWAQAVLEMTRFAHSPAQPVSKGVPHARTIEPFEGFVRQHERALLNYLWRLLGDEPSAYDLTQETFVRAWQHFEQISGYERPRAWLFRVATHLALSHRQRRAHPVGAAGTLDESIDLASCDPTEGVAEQDLVRQILRHLPPKRRAALVLREVSGLSTEEVGQILGMRSEAVMMALSRARAQFRQLYVQEERQL